MLVPSRPCQRWQNMLQFVRSSDKAQGPTYVLGPIIPTPPIKLMVGLYMINFSFFFFFVFSSFSLKSITVYFTHLLFGSPGVSFVFQDQIKQATLLFLADFMAYLKPCYLILFFFFFCPSFLVVFLFYDSLFLPQSCQLPEETKSIQHPTSRG